MHTRSEIAGERTRPHHRRSRWHRLKKRARKGLWLLLFLVFLIVLARVIAEMN